MRSARAERAAGRMYRRATAARRQSKAIHERDEGLGIKGTSLGALISDRTFVLHRGAARRPSAPQVRPMYEVHTQLTLLPRSGRRECARRKTKRETTVRCRFARNVQSAGWVTRDKDDEIRLRDERSKVLLS